jgi:protease I
MTQTTSPLRALLNVEASTSLPRLSNAQMLEAPQNRAIRDTWLLPENPNLHTSRRVAVVATDGVEEIELTTVLHYFRSRGAQVDLIAPKKPSYPDFLGLQIPAVRETHLMTITFIATGGWIKFDRHLEDASAKDYDVVIIPGGVWNPDTLRNDAKAIGFVQEAAAAGKIVAAICHGPWILSDAGLTRGRRATGWWSIDGKIVTARAPIDLAAFVHAIDDVLVAA